MATKSKSQTRRREVPPKKDKYSDDQPVHNKVDAREEASVPPQPAFLIVGVGASAGGLESFMEMFKSLPPDTGMSFVLIQHLSPQHLSILSSLVQKATRMNVQEAVDQTLVKPNNVYIIPPNTTLEIFHGVLHLSSRQEPHGGMPVNAFLTSLAKDQGNLAVGIILSGTGSDGANGLRDIKADGGITLVQQPTTAKFDGMPQAAIEVAAPDFILPIEAISSELVKISSHPIVKKTLPIEDNIPSPETEQILQKIFLLVRNATKIDFSSYKYPTLIRRIKRRMVLHRVNNLKHYLEYLQITPLEVRSLFEDLLINVTDFFRDNKAFESLKTKVFPEIIKSKIPSTPIRIWVPGCSTGEEVYSIAISLIEYLGESLHKYPIQIYGTDICEPAIKIARLGIYPETAAPKISQARLERFFIKEQGGYRIMKSVRHYCIFSIQDVTSHPPINRLDLLSCRNLMIYLGTKIQKKLMDTFHYALNPNGFLMLGSSESVGPVANLFAIMDNKNKIYSKKSAQIPYMREISEAPSINQTPIAFSGTTETTLKPPLKTTDPVFAAEQLMLEKYSPAWLLVNQALDIVQFRGHTDHFIAPASGQPTWNLMKMLRTGLSPTVRVLIHSAIKEQISARKSGLKVTFGKVTRAVDIEVAPIRISNLEQHFLIVFMEQKVEISKTGGLKTKGKKQKTKKKEIDPSALEITALKEELQLTHNSLQSIIEDQSASSEEMQSTTEEVLSANEELQSTNEELETAKEELQSTNEELSTLNDELTNRNNELDHLSNDLINVLSNANVSIVMVDSELRIRRFTPMAEKLLNLIPTDVGRVLTVINFGFQIENLDKQITSVIQTLETFEKETRDQNGIWYSVRIRPYKTIDNKIDGAVIVFVNINDVKIKQIHIEEATRYSDGVIQTIRDPLVVLDQNLCVERANQAFYDTFQVIEKDTIGRPFYELGNRQWNIPELRNLLEDVLPQKSEVRNFEVVHHFEKIGAKIMTLNARTLEWAGQKKHLILIRLHDLTEREQIKKIEAKGDENGTRK
ncbi:MAG: chemotaxis protein CheB [Oligoflexia bacterium]|nr:chemotaxis protein CheB [Oligoflexia bacterium]